MKLSESSDAISEYQNGLVNIIFSMINYLHTNNIPKEQSIPMVIEWLQESVINTLNESLQNTKDN